MSTVWGFGGTKQIELNKLQPSSAIKLCSEVLCSAAAAPSTLSVVMGGLSSIFTQNVGKSDLKWPQDRPLLHPHQQQPNSLTFTQRRAALFYIHTKELSFQCFLHICVSLDIGAWTLATLTSQLRQMWRNTLVPRADKQHVHLGRLWF